MTLKTVAIPANFQPASDLLGRKVALVTGAGQGLGKVAALAFARHGASVILHGRKVAKLEAVYDEIVAAGFAEPAILPMDYLNTNQAELDAFAQSIQTTFGGLDVIFHGASHFVSCMPLEMHDLATFLEHARINFAVPAALTKACLPMLKRAGGSVIFLTESHAIEPRAFWGAFAATKGALANLTVVWADEMDGQTRVRINLCLPGPVVSPMRGKSHPGEVNAQLRPQDALARYFLYLASDASAPLSGALLDCSVDSSAIP